MPYSRLNLKTKLQKLTMADISDYLATPEPDGKEWIKRKVLGMRWELRRTIEQVEYLAEQYQLKKKYSPDEKEIKKIETELRESLQKAHDIAVQIGEFT